MEYQNAIFIVTDEQSCPIYNRGEEFRVEKMVLTVPESKLVCLLMVRELMKAVAERQNLERLTAQGLKKNTIECGGCVGRIRCEFKREKGFATLQMKLLFAAEQRRH